MASSASGPEGQNPKVSWGGWQKDYIIRYENKLYVLQ
jgi:hypothetical protein